MILSTWGRDKELERNDFVVYVEAVPGVSKLVAGVYREEKGNHTVSFFSNKKLVSIVASPLDLLGGVIVGTEDKSFELRDMIIEKLDSDTDTTDHITKA